MSLPEPGTVGWSQDYSHSPQCSWGPSRTILFLAHLNPTVLPGAALYLHCGDQLLPVNRIIACPSYYMVEGGADIVLLELEDPVNVSTHIHSISLLPALETFPSGTSCWVTGWGDIDNDGMWQT